MLVGCWWKDNDKSTVERQCVLARIQKERRESRYQVNGGHTSNVETTKTFNIEIWEAIVLM